MKPVSLYYHYTDCEGFAGIISSKTLRLTQVNRPDDPLEATISESDFIRLLDQFRSDYECVDEIKSKKTDGFINNLNVNLRNSQYAFSLTTLRDSTDHWNNYGNSGKGICIVFNLDYMKPLLKAGESLDWDIINVIEVGYNLNSFKEMICEKLTYIEEKVQKIDDLVIELLHRDIAIGKKSSDYSKYVETRLVYSDNNVRAA